MNVAACPNCGSRKIFQGRLKEGVLTGYTDRQVCRDCGYQGTPLVFDNIEEYHKFQKAKKSDISEVETKDQNIDEKIDLSKKEKEMISFLDELDDKPKTKSKKAKPKKDKPKKEPGDKKEFNVVKNSLVGLSIVLIVTGIWLAARGGFLLTYGLSLLIVGIILFIVGLLSGKDKDEADQSSKPTFGGIFLMMAGVLGSFTWLPLMYASDEEVLYSPFFEMLGLETSSETLMSYILVILTIATIFSILSVIGGLLAIKRKNFNLTILCGFFGLLAIGPLFSSFILAFAGLFLIMTSKNEFKE